MGKKTGAQTWLTYELPTVLFTGVLMCSVMLLYAPIISGDFLLLNDYTLLISNPLFGAFSLQTLWQIFSAPDVLQQYQPLTTFVYMFEHTLFGFNPRLFHLVNVLLHAGNALLVFVFVSKLTKREAVAFVVAVLFAVHPLQVETVAWVSAMNGVLATFCVLSSALLYFRYLQQADRSALHVSVFLYAAALLCKPTVSFWPLVLLLIDWQQRRPITTKVLREKAHFFLLAVAFGVAAWLTLPPAPSLGLILSGFFFPFWRLSLYLQKLFVPLGLAPAHPLPVGLEMQSFTFGLTLLVPFVFLFVFWLAYRRHREACFGLAFFSLCLLPALMPVTSLHNNFLPEREVYLAVVGVFFAVVTVLEPLVHRLRVRRLHPQLWVVLVLVVTIGPLLSLSSARVKTWRTNEELFLDILKTYPGSPLAHHQLGMTYQMQGLEDRAAQHYLWFFQTQNVEVKTAEQYVALGTFFEEKLMHKTAAWAYEKALGLDPELSEAQQSFERVKRRLPDKPLRP